MSIFSLSAEAAKPTTTSVMHFFFFQAEDGIRDFHVTGVQTCALPISGVNHRDCYICHFLLHTDKAVDPDDLRLSVIDLHRAQVRDATPRRWRDKDLA